MAKEPEESKQGMVALAFARALVAGDYRGAHDMLASSLREQIPPPQLQAKYEAMIEYGDEPPDFVGVMGILDDWPTKQKEDVGWAYVAISGGTYSEAVAVVVAQEGGQRVIREIEWGRP